MARPRVYRAEALVLRRSNFGEADRLITLLTPEAGKLRALNVAKEEETLFWNLNEPADLDLSQ